MASVSSKRRRTSIGNTTIEGTNSLSDLPSGILVHAATFLATPSRALFAAALMDDAQVVNQLSSAIAGDQTTLDFGDIEKELALNLSDGDINSALLCIDAVNKLKKLRITNCVFITGIGLEPLRGSAIIQQIDLSLTCDGEGPSTLDLESSISFGIVLPILDSIIERGVVQHITLPRIWREERFEDHFTEGEVHQFLIRYNQMISNRNREGSCTNCDSDLVGVEWVEMDDTQETYGLQNYICCRCMKIYCYGCSCRVVACDQCERLCCQECTTTLFCDYCDTYYCADCKDVVECSRSECNYKVCADCMEICDKCEKRWCSDCFTVQSRCPICPERLCSDCSREKGVTPATFCGTCGTDHCDSCYSFRCPRPILNQNKWLKRENDRLKTEIRHLKDENRRLLASQGM